MPHGDCNFADVIFYGKSPSTCDPQSPHGTPLIVCGSLLVAIPTIGIIFVMVHMWGKNIQTLDGRRTTDTAEGGPIASRMC